MDENDPQSEKDITPEPIQSVESVPSTPSSQPSKSLIRTTFPTFISAGSWLKTHFLRPKRTIMLLAIVVLGPALFFVGYNLAVYQEQNSDTLLPHFNFSKQCDQGYYDDTTSCSSGNCNGRELDDEIGCGNQCGLGCSVEDEPVIYLYPTHTENVDVKISYVTGLSKTLPVYNPLSGWKVTAQPNGTLSNSADGKTYPYLIWEGNPAPLHFDMSSGFVVKGSETSNFLQRQLAVIGLNQNEIDAFIAYWSPKMKNNPYNLIHYADSEYTSLAPLRISPKPDSLLRVSMAFKPLAAPVNVSPQTFPAFHRTGFTAVEWGGTELDSNY